MRGNRPATPDPYTARRQVLARLPVFFRPRALAAAAGISPATAWKTCRRWVDEGVLEPADHQSYRQRSGECRLPAAYHLTQFFVHRDTVHITGPAALYALGHQRARPTCIDVVSRRQAVTAPLPHQPAIRFHRHPLLAGLAAGITFIPDGGRTIRLAEPARVLIDALALPGLLPGPTGVVALMTRKRPRISPSHVLDLLLAAGSPALWARFRQAAAAAGWVRAGQWAAQMSRPPHPGQ